MGGRPTAVGMHIYSGAFTLGVRRAGFEIAGQWEEGPWGAATFERNFPRVPHPLRREEWPVDEARGDTVFMYANPPCAPWSVAGKRLGMADPRVVYTDNCVETALQVEPDFFVWESVPRALTLGRPKVDEVTARFHRAGYAVTWWLTNTVLHGLSQSRERFHLIAHRYELDLRLPRPEKIQTVRDAIGDCEESAVPVGQPPVLPNHVYSPYDEKDGNVVARLQQGEGWNIGYDRATSDGMPARKGRFLTWRIFYDAPSGTLADAMALVHPAVDRRLTIREAARLCGYPDTFVFDEGSPGYRWTGGVRAEDVTQAVMPVIGEFLGRTFLRSLDAGTPAVSGTLEQVDWRPYGRPFTPRRFMKRCDTAPI